MARPRAGDLSNAEWSQMCRRRTAVRASDRVRGASMGPCFISTEDSQARFRRKHFNQGFNGAVLHQHGRLRRRCWVRR